MVAPPPHPASRICRPPVWSKRRSSTSNKIQRQATNHQWRSSSSRCWPKTRQSTLDYGLVTIFRSHPEVVFRSHPDVEPAHLLDCADDRTRLYGGKPRVPIVVVYPYFGHTVAEPLGFYQKFGVHKEPDRLYIYPLDQALRDQLEGAVHIPVLQVKE